MQNFFSIIIDNDMKINETGTNKKLILLIDIIYLIRNCL